MALAEQEAKSLKKWYREKYNLPLHDPRFTSMTMEELILEYETDLCYLGETKKTCPRCKAETFRKECPLCKGVDLTGDMEADDLFARIEAGEDVDLDVLDGRPQHLRPIPDESKLMQEIAHDQYEPIQPGQKP